MHYYSERESKTFRQYTLKPIDETAQHSLQTVADETRKPDPHQIST